MLRCHRPRPSTARTPCCACTYSPLYEPSHAIVPATARCSLGPEVVNRTRHVRAYRGRHTAHARLSRGGPVCTIVCTAHATCHWYPNASLRWRLRAYCAHSTHHRNLLQRTAFRYGLDSVPLYRIRGLSPSRSAEPLAEGARPAGPRPQEGYRHKRKIGSPHSQVVLF